MGKVEEFRLEHSHDAGSRALATRDRRKCGIDVSDVSLQYPIGPHVRGSLKANLMKLAGHKGERIKAEYVEAISHLNLTIQHGERVALIGTNGSGKSTLLRALAGVYPPRSGLIRVQGQIGTLLDVGLGFESESTGRENIYYRGMAMGIAPRRLRAVESRIVAFADLGPFIDLPMRTYSAGMWVRLGFAISTQFFPDILLVDEVFGAGDAGFQARALERMKQMVAAAGIVVIATHDMALVESFCTRVVWLRRGEIERDGPPSVVIPQFLAFATA